MSGETDELPTRQQPYDELRPDQLPRDPSRDGAGWTLTTREQGGAEPDTMPQAIEVTDAAGRVAVYVPITDTPANRPQDPGLDGAGWTFRTAEHDAHDVQQVIEATDADGITTAFVPLRIGGKIVIMRSSG
jgi:hypothetical protein